LAPGKQNLASEPIPKSIERVLNAAKTREEYAERKRKGQAGDDGPAQKKQKVDKEVSRMPKIKPGESLQHFNK
jgi:hypothetical protein